MYFLLQIVMTPLTNIALSPKPFEPQTWDQSQCAQNLIFLPYSPLKKFRQLNCTPCIRPARNLLRHQIHRISFQVFSLGLWLIHLIKLLLTHLMMALLGVSSGSDGMKGKIGKLLKTLTSQDCQLTPQKSFKSIKDTKFPKVACKNYQRSFLHSKTNVPIMHCYNS